MATSLEQKTLLGAALAPEMLWQFGSTLMELLYGLGSLEPRQLTLRSACAQWPKTESLLGLLMAT
jgi:hypothetical protein